MHAWGITDLILDTLDSYNSLLYLRFINDNISLSPDCNGIWKWGINRFDWATNSIISSLHKLGSILDILNLEIVLTSSNDAMRSIKRASFLLRCPSITSVPCPKSPKLTPVRTISLQAWSPIWYASFTISSIVPLRDFPLANGIVQKLHL